MKMTKKITTFLLTICLLATCFAMSVFAADGKIMFEDPTTKAGQTFEMKGVVEKNSGNFGKIEITMKYDTDMLEFKSGEDVTETENGVLVYKGDATNDRGTRKEFTMKFKALKEGVTEIKIKDSTIKNVAGSVLDYTEGYSKVTIKAGDGTATTDPGNDTGNDTGNQAGDGATIEINGANYTIASEIPENEIPDGYEETTLEYDGTDIKSVYNEEFGVYLVYLLDEDFAGQFFMYDDEYVTFVPYAEITIAEDTKIILLTELSDIVLPERYVEDTITVNGAEFAVWRDSENPEYYIMYALTMHQEKNLYQYDSTEGTYQRFAAPEVKAEEEDTSFLGKVATLFEEHLDYIILGFGFVILLFIIVIVILSVKLYNRNAELDELYDEYGIGDNDRTEDDVMFDFDDMDDEDEEELSEEELDSAAFLVQEGMKEITEVELSEFLEKISEQNQQEKVYHTEATLGKALEKVAAQQNAKDEIYDDDEIFENFSVDFIDLDD